MSSKLIEFLLYVLVHVAGNKYKRLHVYGMLLLYTVTISNICIAQFFFREAKGQLQHDLNLHSAYEYIARTSAFFCLYAVPNIKWLFAYLCVYALGVSALTIKAGDFDNDLFSETFAQQPAYFVVCFLVFYIT